jgi:hypothetical protein
MVASKLYLLEGICDELYPGEGSTMRIQISPHLSRQTVNAVTQDFKVNTKCKSFA